MTQPLPASYRAALARLEAWQQATGQTDPATTVITDDGFRLGAWLAQQRLRYRRGTLPAARVQALTAAGITWEFTTRRVPSALADRWWTHLATITGFTQVHGRLPRCTEFSHSGVNLGEWLSRQREAHTAGRLTTEQTAALDALPGSWRQPEDTGRWSPDEAGFTARVDLLGAYATEHGNPWVPQGHRTPEGFALGQWLADQRWKHGRGDLAPARVALLDAAAPGWAHPRTARLHLVASDPADVADGTGCPPIRGHLRLVPAPAADTPLGEREPDPAA